MNAFSTAYQQLNTAQRAAVDAVEGPLLVLAGPGTGKTQLLGMRVANILLKTDTMPQNILCLTFTESGASNMRERLSRFIGPAAYDVQIATYHEFGGGLIKRFADYFSDTRLERPIDELGKHQLIEAIVANLSYLNPLKQSQYHLSDLISTISEVKRALLSGNDLRALAIENQAFMRQADQLIGAALADFSRMPSKLEKASPAFEQILAGLAKLTPDRPVNPHFAPLAQLATSSLTEALAAASDSNKTTPLTKWKNDWLARDHNNQFVLAGGLANRRLEALADVVEQYQDQLAAAGYYDFDDMILRAIAALETNDDLRFSLQERYQYLLLDEFQDTNAAQFKLVQLLTDNPVHEGRPNVMAVGDDDQAIYAFQGATYSNMLDFYNAYRQAAIINLTHNYRSHAEVLAVAAAVADQIEARLHHHFDGFVKQLVAANDRLPPRATIERHQFVSDIAQYDWIAAQAQRLIEQGVPAHEIAVLAPKHKFLEPLVPHLNARGLPVSYEKRENILEAPIVRQLLGMGRLVLALRDNDQARADSLWPEVLSYDFWRHAVSDIWQISWAVAAQRGQQSWSQALLDSPVFQAPAILLLGLANQADEMPLELMLDHLTGTASLTTNDERQPTAASPLRDFLLTDDPASIDQPEQFYHTISHLTVLRARLREHQQAADRPLVLRDLLRFVELYERSGQQMLNTSPYNQQADAIRLMTVFKAKGLEFAHVFMPTLHDDVWGETSRGGSNRLTLPANLAPIRPGATTPDERLRIFFVALTRARHGLYLTSFSSDFGGRATRRLQYMAEQEQADGSYLSGVLPAAAARVIEHAEAPPAIEQLELNWRSHHFDGHSQTSMRDLLAERLQRYQLSPTHLNKFTDLVYGGPQSFFFDILLQFPSAPGLDGIFGSVMHETFEWQQRQLNSGGRLPALPAVEAELARRLASRQLPTASLEQLQERGLHALRHYMAARGDQLQAGDLPEVNFKHEGSLVGPARMGGKADLLRVDKQAKTICLVDYKTGASYSRWASDSRLHKYKQQLYAYKLVIEQSQAYRGFTVNKAILEFVEPDQDGAINHLELRYEPAEVERTRQLIIAMWQAVQHLSLPDVSDYGNSLKEIIRFEDDLIAGLKQS